MSWDIPTAAIADGRPGAFQKNFLAKIIGRRNILLSLEVIHEVEEIFGSYYGLRTDAALGSGRRPI
jgi:hypothetical protein